MRRVFQAGLVYFAIVFGTGFAIGVIRVPFLVPRIGERWAELAEMPVMATVIFYAADYVLRRFPQARGPGGALIVGFVALALLVVAELVLATLVQDRTLTEYVASRDQVSGTVYLVMLLVFALMPRIRLTRHAPSPPGARD
jgi:hypothetical protein